MQKILVFLPWVLGLALAQGQEVTLPTDFRQHNLTHFGSSLINASMGPLGEVPNSLVVWSRWQWQDIDGDPSSLFVDYAHQMDGMSRFGVGFLQHNTGLFLHIGGNLNYARAIPLDDGISLLAGINIFVFQHTVADERYLGTPVTDPSPMEATEGFRAAFSPGLQLAVQRFRFGLALENALGLVFSGEGESANLQHVTVSLSNDFPLPWTGGGAATFLRPLAYVKTIPGADTQFGLNALLASSKFWAQGGYNSFYGISAGLGMTLARSLSLGGLMEFPQGPDLDGKKPSIELLVAYRFGRSGLKETVSPSESEDRVASAFSGQERVWAEQRAAERAKIQKEKDSLERQTEYHRVERERLDSLALLSLQRERDSLSRAVQARKKDSLEALATQTVEPLPQEKFEEVQGEVGLEPGFYLIANVFGTKRYFDAFMKSLADKGLEPKSFHRASNGFNYVYLERYGTMEEARGARDSKFFGKYGDQTWIFRVRGQ